MTNVFFLFIGRVRREPDRAVTAIFFVKQKSIHVLIKKP
jgi:hypothetical protein